MTTLELRQRLVFSQVLTMSMEKQAEFGEMVSEGCDPQLALMVVSKRAPGFRGSDRVFNENARHRMMSMPEKTRDRIVAKARAKGIDTQGKFYVGGLGRYDDPMAWVSEVADIKKVAEIKELIVEGVVSHDPGETASLDRETPKLADSVRDDIVDKRLASDPKLQEQYQSNPEKTVRDLREEVVEKHGRQT